VVLLLVLVAVLHGIQLEHRLNALPGTLRAVTTDAEQGRLGRADNELQQVQSALTSVNSALYDSPDFQLVGWLPVARQNIDAVRSAVQLGLQMVGGGEQIIRSAAPLQAEGQLRVPLSGGQIPVQAIEAVQSTVQDVATGLPVSSRSPSSALVLGRVKSAVNRVYEEAARRRSELTSVAASLRLLDDIAGAAGNRTYLIAVSNSAEMRGSGGMILSYGVLTSRGGKVALGHFGPIDEIKLRSPQTAVTFPADFVAKYGGLGSSSDWREVNIMSDFTIDAPVMQAMYEDATGQHVDGVIQVDSAGLAAVLAGIGPVVSADLGTVSSANAVQLTLNTAYQEFPERAVRQDYTGQVAQAAFSKLTSGDFSTLKPLGVSLAAAAAQHHVLMWADDPTDETAVRLLGAAGALPPARDAFAQLTVENFGGDKLDYYMRTGLALTGKRPTESGSRMTATIDLANTAPPSAKSPRAIFGPFLPSQRAGEYYGLVTLYLTAGTYLQGWTGGPSLTTPPIVGSQNGVRTVTYTVAIPAGAASRVILRLVVPPVPPQQPGFLFIPSPRVIPTVFEDRLS
jgi:hypothetical protein